MKGFKMSINFAKQEVEIVCKVTYVEIFDNIY